MTTVSTRLKEAGGGVKTDRVYMDLLKSIEDGDMAVFFKEISSYLDTEEGKTEILEFMENNEFEGFDKDVIKRAIAMKIGNKAAIKIAALVAMRGTNKAQIGNVVMKFIEKHIVDRKLTVLKTTEAQLQASCVKFEDRTKLASTDLTASRICSAIPDVAALCMFRYAPAKKMTTQECPAWLQFPAAAGIPLPPLLLAQHKAFSTAFSTQIATKAMKELKSKDATVELFNENLYNTMVEKASWVSNDFRDLFLKTTGLGAAAPDGKITWVSDDQIKLIIPKRIIVDRTLVPTGGKTDTGDSEGGDTATESGSKSPFADIKILDDPEFSKLLKGEGTPDEKILNTIKAIIAADKGVEESMKAQPDDNEIIALCLTSDKKKKDFKELIESGKGTMKTPVTMVTANLFRHNSKQKNCLSLTNKFLAKASEMSELA